MSRATISTGNITFDTKKEPVVNNKDSNDACYIVILADFSGRDHRGLNNIDTIKQRKIIEVDRDNFDEIFTKLDVQCALPIADEAMRFNELDDMHPDFIYEHISLFNHLRKLKRKLKNPSTFTEAAEEIYQWHDASSSSATSSTSSSDTDETSNEDQNKVDTSSVDQGLLLNNILSELSAESAFSQFDVKALIKDIVAPYASPKADPREKELLQTIDEATSSLMRQIMHHRQFQNIESAWRSLYMLVRRIETGRKLKLFIVDVSQQELIDDALANDLEQSSLEQTGLYKLLVSNRASTGATPFSLIMHDASFGHSADDINGLAHLGAIASACGAVTIASGSEKLAGCQSLAQTPDKDDWSFIQDSELTAQWEALRSSPQASGMMLVAPRYLCRMPYGKKSSPIDSFKFEELPTKGTPTQGAHPYYLWSSAAWLVTLLLSQNYTIGGDLLTMQVQEIDRLPLHVFYDADGESSVTPCAEIHMVDSASLVLRQAGLMTVRSILNKDSVIIPNLVSIQK